MTAVFLKIVNMAIAAGWIVPVVLLLRLLLRKAPKWSRCLLWGIVALRLLLPVTPVSVVSLVPGAEAIPEDIVTAEAPAIQSGIPVVDSAVNPLFAQEGADGGQVLPRLLEIGMYLWLTGAALMLLYGAFSWLRLRRRLQICLKWKENIYLCDDLPSPFVFGLFSPGIYIPSGMEEGQMGYVIAHEQAHIRRRDHWWKPLGYLLLTAYWFHPLLWLAYGLLCRDIEQACDEKVVSGMEADGIRAYSQALIDCSVHRRMILTCPVAFGETGVKGRVQNILRYKKPAYWLVAISVATCTVVAVCFLTSPPACAHAYDSACTQEPTCTHQGMETHTCRLCRHSYVTPLEVILHSYAVREVQTLPTCTREGVQLLQCTDCGEERAEVLPVTPHTAGELTVTREANCVEKGEVTSVCTLCAAVFVAQEPEKNGVHAMQQTVLRAATCTEEGSALNACTRCGHEENEILPLAEHDYKTTGTKRPTCSHSGALYQKCRNCTATRVVPLAPSKEYHKWENWDTVQHCVYCGIIRGSLLPALPWD